MGTRVHRLGTIYSRITGLIRKGYLKESDRPIWLDIYESFPPKNEPTYKRQLPDIEIKVILYKEDALRAKIHKTLGTQVGLINLSDNKPLFCESLLKTCQKYIAEGMSEEEAIEKLKELLDSSQKITLDTEEDVSEVEKTLSEVL